MHYLPHKNPVDGNQEGHKFFLMQICPATSTEYALKCVLNWIIFKVSDIKKTSDLKKQTVLIFPKT